MRLTPDARLVPSADSTGVEPRSSVVPQLRAVIGLLIYKCVFLYQAARERMHKVGSRVRRCALVGRKDPWVASWLFGAG